MFHFGWRALCLEAAVLNLVMAIIAWRLPPQPISVATERAPRRGGSSNGACCMLSFTLFLYSFGYGGITSFTALYADANGVTPKGIYLTTLAVVILVTRPLSGRLGDRFGYRRVFLPCLVLIAAGSGVPGPRRHRAFWLVTSAVVFGAGFGTAYPVFAGYVMRHVGPIAAARRSAPSWRASTPASAPDRPAWAGSSSDYGFAAAFGTAAALSALALPYFLLADRWFPLAADAKVDGPLLRGNVAEEV